MEILKRMISALLALVIVVTMLPLSALATESEPVTAETESVGDGVLDVPEETTAEIETVGAGVPDGPEAAETEEVETALGTTAPEVFVEETAEAVTANVTNSGTCGENLTWTREGRLLTISGTGDMFNYGTRKQPWDDWRDKISVVNIENGVTSIGNFAFSGCSWLESITIPDSVTTIGDGAFQGCSHLQGITIPDSVTAIGDSAFYQCYNLKSITIPDSVTTIGDKAFHRCSKLTSITIPDSVTTIGAAPFGDCSYLTSINVNENNMSFASVDGVLYTKDITTLVQYPDGNSASQYVIPDSVTAIGDGAFAWCDSLTSVTIPDSTTIIGDNAFMCCIRLANITIPNSVTTIGDEAFSTCYSLTSITIPDSVTTIGDAVCFQCHNLTSITILGGVTSIGYYAFFHCYSVTSITIPDSVTSIDNSAFAYCDDLKDVYYSGCESQWNAISYKFPEEVQMHYNSTGPGDKENDESDDNDDSEYDETGPTEPVEDETEPTEPEEKIYHFVLSPESNPIIVEAGETLEIVCSLFRENERIAEWPQPYFGFQHEVGTDVIKYIGWEKNWAGSYVLKLEALNPGTEYIRIFGSDNDAEITVAVEVTPVDPLDGLTKEEWIQKHIDYAGSDSFNKQVVSGFSGSLNETYEEVKSNSAISAYNTLDSINKVLGLEIEDLDDTQEYELLLTQILFSKNGVTSIENMYNEYLSEAYVKVCGVILKHLDKLADFDKKKIEEMKALLDTLNNCVSGSSEFNSVLDKLLEKLKESNPPKLDIDTFAKSGISFATKLTNAQVETYYTTIKNMVVYMAAGEAYCNTSDTFIKVLQAMRSNVGAFDDPYFKPVGSAVNPAELRKAIDNFCSSIESYKVDGGQDIAAKAVETYVESTIDNIVDTGLDVVLSLLKCVPVVKAFDVIKKLFDGTQFVIDTFTCIDEQAYHGAMVMRLNYIAKTHYFMLNGMAKNRNNWGRTVVDNQIVIESEAQFKEAMLFDEAVAVYRAILNVATEYAKQYHAVLYNALYDRYPGHKPPNGKVSALEMQQLSFGYEWCHTDYLSFVLNNNIHTFNSDNLVVYELKCPVEVTVKDEAGNVIAVLRNGESEIAEGYEHYFFTTEAVKDSGEYLKIATVPKTYSISIDGTGTGTMDAVVTDYSNCQVGETRYFLDIPITDDTVGHFTDSENVEEGSVLVIDDETIVGNETIQIAHDYQLGDVSHDGKINAKDSTLLLQKVVGVLKDNAKFCETCADVSGDGKLNAKDSTLILQVVVGLRDSFPAQN